MQAIKDQATKTGTPDDQIDYKGLKEHKTISKLSSAGLIYKHYGKEVIKTVGNTVYKKELNDEDIYHIFTNVYDKAMLEIDAHDNGVNQAENLVYNIDSSLSNRVGAYNSPWNAPESAGYTQHMQFKRALKICEQYFMHCLYREIMIMQPARQIVKDMLSDCESFHPSK